MKTRTIAESDREWVTTVVAQHFGTSEIISRGVRHDTRSLPGSVFERDGEKLGLLCYNVLGARCEVVVLIALRQRQGIGRQLLSEMASVARARGCTCLWLVTTNNNRLAQRFFEALGWNRVAVHRGAVAAARRLKPEIPMHDGDGTPIEDEIEYEYALEK